MPLTSLADLDIGWRATPYTATTISGLTLPASVGVLGTQAAGRKTKTAMDSSQTQIVPNLCLKIRLYGEHRFNHYLMITENA